jgi:pimeloyl-ACP methyl ester carboxylesterase
VAPAEVHTLDLPGTGTSAHRDSPATVDAIVDDCRLQWRARGFVGPVRLFGLSLGGMVALQWARRYPNEVAGCVVVNTSARPFGPFWQRLRPPVWAPLLAVLLARDPGRAEARVLRCTSAWPARHGDALAAWIALRAARPVTLANALRQLVAAARHRVAMQPPAVPLILLCSAGDGLVDPACSRRLAQRWQVPLAEHPSAGHDLPLDDPQWVVEQVRCLSPSVARASGMVGSRGDADQLGKRR